MLLNDYEWGRTETGDAIERYCKLEGIDYAYLKTRMEAKSSKGRIKKLFKSRFTGGKKRKTDEQAAEYDCFRSKNLSLIAER